MPPSMAAAFTYIKKLKHDEKPNYRLIKLLLIFDQADEDLLTKSYLKNVSENAKGLLYDCTIKNHKIQSVQFEEEKRQG